MRCKPRGRQLGQLFRTAIARSGCHFFLHPKPILKDLSDPKALNDLKVLKVLKVLNDLKVLKDLKDPNDLKVLKDPKAK